MISRQIGNCNGHAVHGFHCDQALSPQLNKAYIKSNKVFFVVSMKNTAQEYYNMKCCFAVDLDDYQILCSTPSSFSFSLPLAKFVEGTGIVYQFNSKNNWNHK